MIELTNESRAPIRALAFIGRAREDGYLNEIEPNVKASGRDRAEGEGKTIDDALAIAEQIDV